MSRPYNLFIPLMSITLTNVTFEIVTNQVEESYLTNGVSSSNVSPIAQSSWQHVTVGYPHH